MVLRSALRENGTAQGERLAAVAVRQKTEVPDLNETTRQDVQQESTNELHRIDGHQLLPVPVGGIPPPECHLALLQTNQAAIGDGHAVRVAGQVLDHVLRAMEGAPDMHDPIPTAQLTNESVELGWTAEMFDGAEKAKLALVECGRQEGQEFTAEHAAKHQG